MESTSKINSVNFKRYPYRGVLSSVARELSKKSKKKVSRVSVHYRYNSGDPVVTEMVEKEMQKREEAYRKVKNRKPIYDAVEV